VTLFARAVTGLYPSQMNPLSILTPYFSTIHPFFQAFHSIRVYHAKLYAFMVSARDSAMALSMVNLPKCESNQILSAKINVTPKSEYGVTIKFILNIRNKVFFAFLQAKQCYPVETSFVVK